jgi:hypothetical protein
MLTGDRGEYFALIFVIALSSFLVGQQTPVFMGLMSPTRS